MLNERLIACTNTLDPVSSLFWWEGKIDEASEFLVLMESRMSLFKSLSERVEEIHSYQVSESIALLIIEGLPFYLGWLSAALQLVKNYG